jgi:RNA polymerase sigma-32 factor
MSYAPVTDAQANQSGLTSKQLASEGLSDSSADDEDLPQDIGLHLAPDSHAAVRADDPIGNYMQRLKHLEPLDADTQHDLAVKYYEEEDEWAARMLVVTNLRLVVKIAREYRRQRTDFFELIQEGNVGLSEAITRFDPYRGVKFISYAQYWIRAMILNYLMNQLYPVKFGNTRAGRKLFYNLKKARRELRRQGVEKPSPRQVAEHLGVPRDEVVRVSAQMDAPPVAIDGPAPGYEGVTVGELMPSDSPEPEEQVQQHQLISSLSSAFTDFGEALEDDRDYSIWTERMIAEDAKTLKELGQKWDVSKERIRQVESDIRTRFKHYLIERFGEGIALEVREMVN